MEGHFHFGIESIMFVWLAWWVANNFVKMLAAWLARQNGTVGSVGHALGGTL